MRTFKQFKVGDVDYELFYDTFTHVHPGSYFKAYMNIIDKNRDRALSFKVDGYNRWIVNTKNYRFHQEIVDIHKAQEIRRLIILFLTNSL